MFVNLCGMGCVCGTVFLTWRCQLIVMEQEAEEALVASS